ncbi:hypothetical protein [Alkalilimnicola ehrlichii]|uniref:hypothetical protein n=1 Tax=Alkalilimnicola ehrlichii TaxID=351052 RepID=UPI0015F251CD|nr:hypothetical protein [Alkalilimnicola ehrlichii]
MNQATNSRASLPASGQPVQLSPLAQQLSEAAQRSAERDSTLSHRALGEQGESLLNQIHGNHYHTNKARHDSEVPNTDGPALLERARQATEFVNSANTDAETPNPFAGLSREQLSLIIYDDSGTFTVNERRAAHHEAYRQEQAWKRAVVDKAMDEYNRTGKMTNFYTEVLAHYESLPPIEQAQLPANYKADLQMRIADQTDRRPSAENNPDNLFSLLNTVFADTFVRR